jgi:hypothetical protein
MRGTLFFVHGAGVRSEGLKQTLARIQDALKRNAFDGVELRHSAWGDQAGVTVGDLVATMPEPRTRDITGRDWSPADEAAARWSYLLNDPLFELRLAGATVGDGADIGVAVGVQRADQAIVAMVRGVEARPPDLTSSGLSQKEFADAARSIEASEELAAAARGAHASDGAFVEAIARAIVAAALSPHRSDAPGTEPAALVDPATRDKLVAATAAQLAPAPTRGFFGDLFKRAVVPLVTKQAMNFAAERRATVMGLNARTIADVLSYQRRSEGIRTAIETDLKTVGKRPIVALGHSLGGIALVDVLSRDGHPPVDLLVTVGSQSPMLFAFDALDLIRPGSTVRPFTPWLNIYSRQDFVSFLAAKIFKGVGGNAEPRITDVAIEMELPFPDSHSGYWADDRVWHQVKRAWPGNGP